MTPNLIDFDNYFSIVTEVQDAQNMWLHYSVRDAWYATYGAIYGEDLTMFDQSCSSESFILQLRDELG